MSCVWLYNVYIYKPATCEVGKAIRFLKAKNVRSAETHTQIVELYGEGMGMWENGVGC